MKIKNKKFLLSYILLFFIFLFFGNQQKENMTDLFINSEKNILVTPITNIFSDRIEFKVVKIIDGDTISVEKDGTQEVVRFIGIDTPELHNSRNPIECFAINAKDKLSSLLKNKYVWLESDSTQKNRDKYGRLLRYIFLKDDTLINDAMIKEGYAYEFTYQLPYRYQYKFKDSQDSAEKNKKGLWADDACT